MELEVGGRFISDAFLPVWFSNLSSSNVVYLAVGETTFAKYSSACCRKFFSSIEPKTCKNVPRFTFIVFSFFSPIYI